VLGVEKIRGGKMGKKSPTKISRVVRVKDNDVCVIVNNSLGRRWLVSTLRAELSSVIGPLPKSKYKVTYELDPKGKYKVIRGNQFSHLYRVNKRDGKSYIIVCFIPPNCGWDGKRVSRKVEIL